MNGMSGKKLKVLCPVQSTKDEKKTYWRSLGIAYENRDGSINLYLDALPLNGKLQVREWDEEDRRVGEQTRFQSRAGGGFDGAASASAVAGSELPF